jgi:MFS family permease
MVAKIKEGPCTYFVVVSGLLAVLGSLGFARFGYSMILPGMKDSLALNYTEMGVMASGNFCGYMIFAVIAGVLASRYGPRIVMSASVALVGISMLLTCFIQTYSQALVLISLAGVGCGGANVPAMMLPAVWLPSRRRGLASGIICCGSSIGLIVTGFLVPRLNEIFGGDGWRYSWLTLGVIALIFALFCAVSVRNSVAQVTSAGKNARTFVWRVVSRDSLLWKIGLIYSMFGFSYVVYVTFFGSYLIKEVGFTAESAGVLWALVGVISLVSGPLWGHVSDRIGRRYALALVYFIQSVSFFLFAQKGTEVLYASAVLFGATAWSIPSIVAAYSGDRFGPELSFSVLGFLTLCFGIGQAFGPSAAGFVADSTRTFTFTFFLSSFMAILGGLLSLKILSRH